LTFPLETREGDYFWMNNEPVRITAWNYTMPGHILSYYFDIEFIDIITDGRPAASMVMIPMGFDFYLCDIRKMSSLEMELF